MIAELCIDVINSFKQLKESLATATERICVQDKDLPAWFQAPEKLHVGAQASVREQACALLGQLEYLNSQQPREILVGAGIMAASQDTLFALEALNTAKNNFKKSMLKLRAAKVATNHELLTQNFEALLMQRDSSLSATLSRMGLARLHLKQCYRKIPIYFTRPNKISWTWANTRSIKKISVTEAEALLRKQIRDIGIERQIRLLQGLDQDEKLAIIQDLAPHLRANIVFPDSAGTKRIMVKGPVPIFYLQTDNPTLPEFTPAGNKRGKDKDRLIRKDVKISPECFLPAIRAHRYLEAMEI